MISRQARPVSGRPSTLPDASPVSEERMEEERSARLDSPYEGRIGLVLGSRAIRQLPARATASLRALANASTDAMASSPSAASLIRSVRSSAVIVPR